MSWKWWFPPACLVCRARLTSDKHGKAFQLSSGVFLCFPQWRRCAVSKFPVSLYPDESQSRVSHSKCANCSATRAFLHFITFIYIVMTAHANNGNYFNLVIVFMLFCFKYDFYLFQFQISPLIDVHTRQIPQWRTPGVTGSFLLSKLTMGELHCWLNPSLSWVEVYAEHSR